MYMSCDMVQGCKVVVGNGTVLTELAQEDGESYTIATVTFLLGWWLGRK